MSHLIETRAAAPDDYEVILGLIPELGADDPPPDRERWLQLRPSTRVATSAGRVVAYCYRQVLVDTGYVRQIVVAPDFRRRGIARSLLREAAGGLRRAGIHRWCLNVKDENTGAIRLYESFGFEAEYRTAVLRVPWELATRLPPSNAGVIVRQLSRPDDERFEQQFALKRGQLTSAREKRERIFVALVSTTGEARGVAVFNPLFPGASVFRVATPSLAGALLEGLRAHARPEHDYLQVIVERDRAVADLLLGRGAEKRFGLVHYAGQVPSG